MSGRVLRKRAKFKILMLISRRWLRESAESPAARRLFYTQSAGGFSTAHRARVPYLFVFKMDMNTSDGTSTEPMLRMRFLPSFCFSSSFFLRVMSPP